MTGPASDPAPGQFREAAMALAAEGFRVFPCHTPSQPVGCSCGNRECASPGKHPRTPHGCKDATRDPATIEPWWREWPDANLGVATGDGLLVIDIDGPAGQAALETLASEHGSLPDTRAARTGRDAGRHVWFRLEAGDELSNSSGRLGAGIDTRGQGGYVLAPPSVHATGRGYVWEAPGVPVAPVPAWVLVRLRASRHTNGNGNGGPPVGGADPQLQRRLAALGDAVLSRELKALAEHPPEPGTGRGTALYAAAVRLGRIVAAGGLDLQAAWQQLETAGHRLELGDGELGRSIERGLTEGMTQPLELRDRPRRVERNGATSGPIPQNMEGSELRSQDWPKLASPTLPAFPLEALPSHIAQFVEAVAIETQTPPDLAAMEVLGVLSTATMGTVKVDLGNHWQEELRLYLISVMASGERKDAAARLVDAPIRKIERELRKLAKPIIRERLARKETLETRRQKLVRKAGDDDQVERVAAEEELANVDTDIDDIGNPVLPCLFADDTTPEALSTLLADHAQIAVLASEAALVDNFVGRYDAKGSPNLHLINHAYNGEPTRVNRRGRAEHLERPLLTIVLSVQPHVLKSLVEHPVARDQGLVSRFGLSHPESRQGRREINPPGVPPGLCTQWENTVQQVFPLSPNCADTKDTNRFLSFVSALLSNEFEPSSLSFSPAARHALDELRGELEPRLAEGGDLHSVAHWIARHPGRIARIAGLLHLTQFSVKDPIDEATIRNALRIGEYFLAHALAILAAPDALHRRALKWLTGCAESTISQRDLHRGPLNKRGPAEDADELAQSLVALGALRRLEDDGPPRRGRPASRRYEMNPHLRKAERS